MNFHHTADSWSNKALNKGVGTFDITWCDVAVCVIDGQDGQTSLSMSETAELQQKIQDLHKLNLSQRQEIVQRDTQIEQLVSSYFT